jgi:TorA-specific chaperone
VSLARSVVSPEVGWNALIAEWLAGLFMAPLSAAAVTSYRDGLGATFLDTLLDEPGCAAGVRPMRSALVTEGSAAAVAHKLALAFTILFDGVGGHRSVSPYESAHVSASGRLFQAPVSDMDLLLRQADMSIDDAVGEPSDHLSIELALLARLMRGGSPQAQAALLDDHLLAWVPMFADRCRDADSTGFYAGAASLLMGFLVAQRTAFQGSKAILPVPAMPHTSYATTGVMPCRSG